LDQRVAILDQAADALLDGDQLAARHDLDRHGLVDLDAVDRDPAPRPVGLVEGHEGRPGIAVAVAGIAVAITGIAVTITRIAVAGIAVTRIAVAGVTIAITRIIAAVAAREAIERVAAVSDDVVAARAQKGQSKPDSRPASHSRTLSRMRHAAREAFLHIVDELPT
jgi:hypothetical protein